MPKKATKAVRLTGLDNETTIKHRGRPPAHAVHITWITEEQLKEDLSASYGNSKWRDVFREVDQTGKIAKLEGMGQSDMLSLQAAMQMLNKQHKTHYTMKRDGSAGIAYVQKNNGTEE